VLGIPSATIFYIRDGRITSTNRSGTSVTWVDVTRVGGQPPTLTQEPQDQVVQLNQSVTIRVRATGVGPISYQWYRNGATDPSLTGAVLLYPNIQAAQIGNYYCVLSNAGGSVTSRVASIRLDVPAPTATMVPTIEFTAGILTSFGPTVTGGQPPFTYQWEKDGKLVPGATDFSFPLPSVSAADAGTYRCIVSDAFGNQVIAGPTVLSVLLPPAPRFLIEPQPVTLAAGSLLVLNARFESQPPNQPATAVWRRNGVPVPGGSVFENNGAWSANFQLPDVQPNISGQYDCVATGPGGSVVSRAVRVLVKAADSADAVDASFDPGTANRIAFNNPGGDGAIEGLAVQADDKILITGTFKQWNGQARTNLVRLNVNGSLDTTFAPHHFEPGINGDLAVPGVAVAPDGRIYVAGVWKTFDGVDDGAPYHLVRLNRDGTQDRSFALPNLVGAGDELAILPDGTVYNNGFRRVNNATHYLLKFPAGGAADLGFDAGYSTARFSGNTAGAMAVLPDGGLIVGGFFGVTVGGFAQFNLARINADGSLNAGFRSPLQNQDIVNRVVRLADGRILAVGDFQQSGGNVRRFTAEGAFDTTFVSDVKDAAFAPVSVLADGAVVVAGNTGNNLLRLKSEGAIDDTFTVAVNDDIKLTAVDSRGRIVIAGFFTEVRGQFDDTAHALTRRHVARLAGVPAGGGGRVTPQPVTLAAATVTPGGALGFTVATQVGVTYFLEKKAGFGDPTWTVVLSVTGDGTSKVLEAAMAGTSGFFRIRAQ
jgi:uncharacterized delta-60 repeat protein